MPKTFDIVHSIKSTFLDSSHQYLSNDIYFVSRHFKLLGFEIPQFCETLHVLSPLQVSNLLSFMIEFFGGYRKTPNFAIGFGNDVIMMAFVTVEL